MRKVIKKGGLMKRERRVVESKKYGKEKERRRLKLQKS